MNTPIVQAIDALYGFRGRPPMHWRAMNEYFRAQKAAAFQLAIDATQKEKKAPFTFPAPASARATRDPLSINTGAPSTPSGDSTRRH